MSTDSIKIIAQNRKARHEYFILEEYEAGIVLAGTEVKSLREGRADLKDAYGKIKNGEVWIHQMHISPCAYAYYDNHDPLRTRKLLLHAKEIDKLYSKLNERGMSLIPLKLYFKNGKVKLVLGVAKGKKLYDKRETIKERDEKRTRDREYKTR